MPPVKDCLAFDRLSSYQRSRIDRERSVTKSFRQFRAMMIHIYFLMVLTLLVIFRPDEYTYLVKSSLLATFTTDQFKNVDNDVTSWKSFSDISSTQVMCSPFPLMAHPLRLRPGEDFMEELIKYIESNRMDGAFVLTCVGSVRSVHLRFATGQDGKEKDEYVEENMEVCSLVGTCSKQGFHLHGTFGKANGATISGHILGKMIVQTTVEIVLGNCVGATFERSYDPATGFRELKIIP